MLLQWYSFYIQSGVARKIVRFIREKLAILADYNIKVIEIDDK